MASSESSDTRRKVARLSPVESATRQLDRVGMLVRLALRESDSITAIIGSYLNGAISHHVE